ncbi:MAG TPA: hypothetical protein PL103_07830 [Saccharofermentans sp.]|mgnify:CR=1 FL=1|nr:hypothetical protein [Saccharofermentans sp.]
MLIVAEFLFIWLILRKLRDRSLSQYFFIGLILQFLILLLYRVELQSLGRVVYWSDAEYYWYLTTRFLEGSLSRTPYNFGYVIYSATVLKSSFFVSPTLLNISNLLLLNLSILLIATFFHDDSRYKKARNLFVVLSQSNPLICYSLFRNLKDVLFLFLVIFCIWLFVLTINSIFSRIKKEFTVIAISLLFSVVLVSIRPWGMIVPFSLLIIAQSYIFKINVGGIFITTIILIGALGYITYRYSSTFELWIPLLLSGEYGTAGSSGLSLKNVILGPFRMLIGPGPIRSLLGDEYFMYYTKSGNIACFIGSLMWWVLLPALIALGITVRKKWSASGVFLSVVLIEFLFIYSVAYGGSAELRFRGVLYILMAGAVLLVSDLSHYQIRKSYLLFLLSSILVFFGGVLFGI